MATAEAPKATATTTQDSAAVPYELSAEKMMQDNLLILGLLFFIFYFLLIRPQQKRLKKHQEMMKNLTKGDKIVTGGGIIGTISKLEEGDIVVVDIAQDVSVRITRASVSEVLESKHKGANDN